MAKYSTPEEIQQVLQDEIDDGSTIQEAFDFLLDNAVQDIFEMDEWDVPKFTEETIVFNNIKYLVKIKSVGVCEHTNEHRILYWEWDISELE